MATAMFIMTCVSLAIQVGTIIAAGVTVVEAPSIAGFFADTGMFDMPFVNGISYFVAGLGYAKLIAFLLAQLFCVMGLVWNAFKLWAGAAQVKKTCVEIGAKLIIFSFVYTSYVALTMNLLIIGTGIGETICGGREHAEMMYEQITSAILNQLKGYNEAAFKQFSIIEGQRISEAQFTTLLNYLEKGYTVNDVNTIKNQFHIETYKDDLYDPTSPMSAEKKGTESYNRLLTILKNKMALTKQAGTSVIKKAEVDSHPDWVRGEDYDVEVIENADGELETQYYRITNLNGEYNNMLKRFDVLAKFFHLTAKNEKGKTVQLTSDMLENPAYDTSDSLNIIQDFFRGLYLDFGENVTYSFGNTTKTTPITQKKTEGILNFNPKYISPGSIVKLGSLLCQLMMPPKDHSSFIESDGYKVYTSSILDALLRIIQNLIIIFTTIILAIDYIMMILEYHIVVTVSYIFVPLMLFDGTRQYATRLIGSFLSFFARILVFTMMFYFCIETYLEVVFSQFMGLEDPSQVYTFSHITLTFFLCLILVKKVPQIAQTVLSGSPSMGAGDMIQGVRGALQGGKAGLMAGRQAVNTAHKAMTPVGRTFGNTAVASIGRKNAAQQAIEKARAGGETDAKKLKAIGAAAGKSWLQSSGMSTGQRASRFVGNLFSQAAFGIKDNYTESDFAALGMGKGDSTNHTTTFRNAMDMARKPSEPSSEDKPKEGTEAGSGSAAKAAAEQKPIGIAPHGENTLGSYRSDGGSPDYKPKAPATSGRSSAAPSRHSGPGSQQGGKKRPASRHPQSGGKTNGKKRKR